MTPHRRDAWCTALPWFLLLFSGPKGYRVETKYGTNRVNRGDLSWTVPSALHYVETRETT
jgi:hypothetical protein